MRLDQNIFATVLLLSIATCLAVISPINGQSRNGESSSANRLHTLKPTDQWFTLAPNIDDFSVEMPGLTTIIAPARPNAYIYRRGRSVYSLISFPDLDTNDHSSLEDRLNKAGVAFSKSPLEYFRNKGKSLELPQPRRLNLNGVPGLEYKLSDGQEIYVQRLYRTEKRLYSLKAIVPFVEEPSAERFLNSFTLDRRAPLQFIQSPPARDLNVPTGDPVIKPDHKDS